METIRMSRKEVTRAGLVWPGFGDRTRWHAGHIGQGRRQFHLWTPIAIEAHQGDYSPAPTMIEVRKGDRLSADHRGECA